MELVDLSVPVETGMPVYPGDPEVSVGPALTVARDGVNVLALHLGSQSGTHVDAPYHVDDRLPRLDELPLERFAGRATVVDARGLGPRAPIGPAAFAAVEGGIVLVATGWSRHWGSPAYEAHPYLTEEAAALLVERGVRTVGVDALSVDPTPAEDFPAHRVLCGAHAVIAENLANLGRLVEAQAAGLAVEVWLMPLRLRGADGAPVRAVARLG
ncbi:cyclase family protein [Nonomuraea pusilla]|uniref:Kynurenine formamidase n=1 Tax=Nonomuraea pusilla TaxID=46177 RepID=A0A1H7W1D8_9ACTN|nr:cyclase family protein [Nonomuraea pusilla]SEM14865.1 Kynurenine formamidase [Nonomuraea pusilla]